MKMLVAVVVILALPVVVAADINRLRLSPDLERSDALIWKARRTELSLRAVPIGLSVWVGPSAPLVSRSSKSELRCQCSVPPHVTRCQCDPDRPDRTVMPVLWPHSPRTDERKTAAKERRQKQAQVQDEHRVN